MKVTMLGKHFEVANEPADFWGWVNEGRYNQEWAILERFLRAEHIFIDLGAWVGSHSLYASTICRKIVAFEPDPVAFPIMEANLGLLLARPTVHALRLAVSNRNGRVQLGSGFLGASTTRENPEAGGGIGAWEQGHDFNVECITLRLLVARLGLSDPLFIKMDVEGSEEKILRDTTFFTNHKPTMYLELHPWWWTDAPAVWANIRMIASAYNHVLDIHMSAADLANEPRALIFTDSV